MIVEYNMPKLVQKAYRLWRANKKLRIKICTDIIYTLRGKDTFKTVSNKHGFSGSLVCIARVIIWIKISMVE